MKISDNEYFEKGALITKIISVLENGNKNKEQRCAFLHTRLFTMNPNSTKPNRVKQFSELITNQSLDFKSILKSDHSY